MTEYPEEVNLLISLIRGEAGEQFSKLGANYFCQHLLNVWDEARPGNPVGRYVQGRWVNYE